MFDVTILGALVAGLLSFLSPCVLPLVPPYLCFMAGTSLDQLAGDKEPSLSERLYIILLSVMFVLGFSTVFVSLGSTATFLGEFFGAHMQGLSVVAGIIIIILGLHFLGLFRISLLFRDVRFQTGHKNKAGLVGAYVIGLAFAFGWTPCIGPILASILMIASSEENVQQGTNLLIAYSLGIGSPFIIAAAFTGAFMSFMVRFRRYFGVIEKVVGGMLILTGVLFLTNGMSTISYWLLEVFPVLGQQG